MSTCIIPIGRRRQYAATVDARDAPFLKRWKWMVKRGVWRYGASIYARRDVRVNGRNVALYMHTVILRERMRLRRPGPRHECDHRDTDSLNNTRRNLRWATRSEQNANQRPRITKAQIVAFHVAEAGCAAAPRPRRKKRKERS